MKTKHKVFEFNYDSNETEINYKKAKNGEYCPKQSGLCWRFLGKKDKKKE